MKRVSAGQTRMLCCLVVVWFAWLGPWAAPAGAATYTVALKYAAAPGCPDATDFSAAVIARLGYDPFKDDAPDRVLVQIRPRAASLDGRIEWHDAEGKWAGDQRFPLGRTNCLQLVRAMAFALALQIQFLTKAEAPPPPPSAAVGTSAEKPLPAESSKPPPVSEPPPPVIAPAPEPPAAPTATAVAPVPVSPREAGPVLALGAGPALGLGMSSSPVVLGRAFGGLAWQRFSVELALVLSVPSVPRRPDGAGVSQQYAFVSAASCGASSRLSPWKACLLVNAGGVRLLGRDIDLPTSAVVPLVEAGARLGVVQPLGTRVFLGAHVDGLVRLTRWIGRLDQVPVWSAPRVAATIGVDVGVRFP